MKKRLLSLFSGCGGMDLGFEGNFWVHTPCVNKSIHCDWVQEEENDFTLLKSTSFETVFANDILPFAKAAWVPYFIQRGKSESIFHLESIVDLVKKHKSGDFLFPDGIDVVTGGFPCQDFSVAGKRKGFNSHRSHKGQFHEDIDEPTTENRGMLYSWMREVIQITKPKIFIAENVKGLVSLGNVKEIIEHDFRNIDEGYFVLPAKVLFAPDYGVPQRRERVIFIGISRKHAKRSVAKIYERNNCDALSPYPRTTHYNFRDSSQLGLFENGLLPYVTTSQVLYDLPEPSMCTNDLSQMNYSKAKYGGQTQGQKEIDLSWVAPTIRAEHHGNIEYRRLSLEHGGKHFEELKSGLPERRLTVRECARLQTFPDDYEFVRHSHKNSPYNLSASCAYKVIGNAVPPLLAYNIAKRLEEIWDEVFNK